MQRHWSPLGTFDCRLVDGAVCAEVVQANSVVALDLHGCALGIWVQIDVVTIDHEHGCARHRWSGLVWLMITSVPEQRPHMPRSERTCLDGYGVVRHCLCMEGAGWVWQQVE